MNPEFKFHWILLRGLGKKKRKKKNREKEKGYPPPCS